MHEDLRLECVRLAQSPAYASEVKTTEQIVKRAQAFYNFIVPSDQPSKVVKGTIISPASLNNKIRKVS